MRANKDHSLSIEKRQEIKERLLLCFDVLRERHIADTYADVAKAMGMNAVTVRSAFARTNSYLSDRFLHLFLSTYSGLFSEEWLYTGLGEMIGESPSEEYAPMTERWHRVEMIMNNEGLNHITMSDAIGLNNHTTLYRVVRQHKKPQDETLRRILRRYPWYSEEWLLDGIGSPISDDVTSPVYIDHFGKAKGSTAQLFEPQEMMSFPIAKEHARAGVKTGYGDEEYESLSHVVLPVDRNYKGEYQVFSVEGASMDDGSLMSLADGDLVLARKIDQQYWRDGLHTRRWLYFIFVTRNDGVLIKKVIGQDLETGTFTLHSLNPEYEDLVINIREVVSIYNVIQVIQRKLSY